MVPTVAATFSIWMAPLVMVLSMQGAAGERGEKTAMHIHGAAGKGHEAMKLAMNMTGATEAVVEKHLQGTYVADKSDEIRTQSYANRKVPVDICSGTRHEGSNKKCCKTKAQYHEGNAAQTGLCYTKSESSENVGANPPGTDDQCVGSDGGQTNRHGYSLWNEIERLGEFTTLMNSRLTPDCVGKVRAVKTGNKPFALRYRHSQMRKCFGAFFLEWMDNAHFVTQVQKAIS